jgi:acyl transferase domain-containing protein
MGGTNAHVVLEEAPSPAARVVAPRGVWLLGLSARTAPALRVLVGRYVDHLQAKPELRLEDVCFTAAAGRVAMKHRLAVIAEDRSELVHALVRLKEDPAWTNLDPRIAARGTGKAIGRGSVGIIHASRFQAEQAATSYAQGAPLQIDPVLTARKAALPSYPFEHLRCWVDGPIAPIVAEASARSVAPQPHPFLRKRTRDLESELDERAKPTG